MLPASNQFTFDFDNFTEKALKPIVKRFEKLGCHVVAVDAPNKPKRESGFQIKQCTLTFEDGQKVVGKIKAGGAIYQVRLNNKVVHIKHVNEIDKAIGEVIGYVQSNAVAFMKAKSKLAKEIQEPKRTDARNTRAQRIAAATEKLAALEERISKLRRDIEMYHSNIAALKCSLERSKKLLEEEKQRTVFLEAEIAKYTAAIDRSKECVLKNTPQSAIPSMPNG